MKYGLWKYLTTFGVTTTVLAGLNLPIQAQSDANLVRLFDTTCVQMKGYWYKEKNEISSGREVYTSIANIVNWGNKSSGVSCRISVNGRSPYQTLSLKFGLNDDRDNEDVIVNIYLDGKLVESPAVTRGNVETFTFNVSQTKSVAIEAVCPETNSQCYSTIHFFWAHLEKKAPVRRR